MAAGNATIGALRVSLGLDSAQFDTGLKAAQGKLSSFGKIAGLGLAGLATAAAGAAVAVGAMVKSQLNAADELGKTAQKVGTSVEALSRLKYAADLSDVSLEGLGNGLKKLSVNMADVASGGGDKAANAFRALGISVTDSNGKLKSSDVVLTEVAGKFGTMEDGATKTALAVALFGKSGADLIPLLNSGADGLAAMAAESDALGVTIDTKTAKAAEAFNDNLTRLGKVGTGLTTQLAAGLAPALADISAGFVESAKGGDLMKGVGIVLAGVLKGLATAGLALAGVFGLVGRAVNLMAKVITLAFQGDFKGALAAYGEGMKSQLAFIGAQAKAIQNIWTGAGAKAAASAKPIGEQIALPLAEGAKRAKASAKTIKDEADKAVEAARSVIAAQQKSFDDRGLTQEQIDQRELLAAASTLVAKGYLQEAAAAARLADELGRVVKVEAAKIDLSPNFVNTPADIGRPTSDGTSGAGFEKFNDTFQHLNAVVNNFADSFDSPTANKIAAGIDRVAQAFAAGGPIAGAMAAVGEVGRAIGGKAGAAIQGFSSGGLLGAALSVFGFNKAKKKAKKKAAAQAKADAEEKAQEEANTKRRLEIELMRAAGNAAGARAAEEEDLLKALSPANQELQKQIFALEREADARAAATALAAQQRTLQAEIADATGNSAEALRIFREDALAELPESLRAAKQALFNYLDAQDALTKAQTIWAAREAQAQDLVSTARDDLSAAYERESSALEDTRDKFAGLADALADLGRELTTGPLAGLDIRRQARSDRAAFVSLSAQAATGDAAALAALPDAIRNFRASSLATASDAKSANADLAALRRAAAVAEAAARGQVSIAQRQLDALTASVSGLININTSVLTVADGINQLNGVLVFLAGVQANATAALGELTASLAGFDAAAVTAALDATPPGIPPAANGNSATDAIGAAVADALANDPTFGALVTASIETARSLDDVINGAASINTVVA